MNAARGGVLVELAILIPVIVLLIGGIVDLSSIIRESNIVVEASRHGARSGGAAAAAFPAPMCSDSTVHYEYSCDAVGAFSPDHEGLRAATERTCEYLELTLQRPGDWKVATDKSLVADEDPVLTVENGVFAQVKVTVSQSEAAQSRCLLCWVPGLSSFLLRAESSFPVQVKCGSP